MGGRSAGVNDAFRDAFMVKMGDLFPQDEVFEQRGTTKTRLQAVLIITDGNALIGG